MSISGDRRFTARQRGDRRDHPRRAEVVWRVISGVVRNPGTTLTLEGLQEWLRVPADGARRILDRLVAAGLVREVGQGVWTRGTYPGVRRERH